MPPPVLHSLNIYLDAICSETHQAKLNKLETHKVPELYTSFESLKRSTHFHCPLELQKAAVLKEVKSIR